METLIKTANIKNSLGVVNVYKINGSFYVEQIISNVKTYSDLCSEFLANFKAYDAEFHGELTL